MPNYVYANSLPLIDFSAMTVIKALLMALLKTCDFYHKSVVLSFQHYFK